MNMKNKYDCLCCNHIIKNKKNQTCALTGKLIKKGLNSCRFFDPTNKIFCNQNGYYLTILQCLNRRRNEIENEGFEKCKTCRQFEKEIKPIIIPFWIDGILIEKKRKINNIEKRKINNIEKRKIKRRGEETIKRKIKRRPKKMIEKRKIKRRVK